MKIKGPLIDILVEISPETSTNYITEENGKEYCMS